MRRPIQVVIVLAAMTAAAAAGPSKELTREFEAGVDAYRLGKHDEARVHLEKARELDPQLPGPHRFLAAVAQAQERWDDCLESARTALSLNPASREAGDTRKLYAACRTSAGLPAFEGELGDGAAIAVSANVTGAEVTIAGLAYGGTPLLPRRVPPGLHEIVLEKAGYRSARKRVTVLAGIVTDVTFELEADAGGGSGELSVRTPGKLGLVTLDADGEVWVDGKLHGGRLELTPGVHVIEVRRAGKDPWRRRVAVRAGTERVLRPELVDSAERERTRRKGLTMLGVGGGLTLAGGALVTFGVLADGETTRRVGIGVGGAALGLGALSLGIGIVWVVRGRAPDLTAPPPYALVPTAGGAIVTSSYRF